MYRNFGMYSVLILTFYFDFPLFTQSVRIKVIYSSTFYEFRKRNSPIAYFVEHPVYSILKMYSFLILVFLFWFTTIHSKWFTQRECVKVTLLKFQVLRERTNVIASFPEHLIYSNFEMFSVLALGVLLWFDFPDTLYAAISKSTVCWSYFFHFDFPLFTQNDSITVIYSWNFKCSLKEAVILLLSRRTL